MQHWLLKNWIKLYNGYEWLYYKYNYKIKEIAYILNKNENTVKTIMRRAKEKIKKAYEEKDTVLDGLYSWDEYVYLKEKFKELVLVSIVCDKEKRYDRVSVRDIRPFNREEIVIRDVSEIENLAKGGPIAYADYYIFNNGTVDNYIERLEEIIREI